MCVFVSYSNNIYDKQFYVVGEFMGQIISSVAGALILLKLVKILLPEGSIKKYASFMMSALVMLIMILSVTGRAPDFSPGIAEEKTMPDTADYEKVMNRQIIREFSRRLEQDMKGAVPELSDCDIEFEFSENEKGEITVVSVNIDSESDISPDVEERIFELYGMPISRRKK